MDPSKFFDVLMARINGTLIEKIVFQMWHNLVGDFQTEIALIAVIMIGITAIMVAMGWASLGYAAKRLIILVIVLQFLDDWDLVSRYIFNVFYMFSDKFVESIGRAYTTPMDGFTMLTTMMNQVVEGAFNVWDKIGLMSAGVGWSIMYALIGFGYFLSGALLVLYVGANLVLAKLGIAIFLVILPIVLIMVLFERTAGALGGWLRGVIGLALIPIVFTIGLVMLMLIIEDDIRVLPDILGNPEMIEQFQLIMTNAFILVIGFALFLKLGKLIDRVVGGISFNSVGIYRRMAGSFGSVGRGTGRGMAATYRGGRRIGGRVLRGGVNR